MKVFVPDLSKLMYARTPISCGAILTPNVRIAQNPELKGRFGLKRSVYTPSEGKESLFCVLCPQVKSHCVHLNWKQI